MTIREIVTLPDPILRRKARTITRFDAELQTLIDDMIETMRDAPGVGLAAPQVGIPIVLSWWSILKMMSRRIPRKNSMLLSTRR